MKKNRMKFLIIEFLLLLLAVFFVWKIFDQNVAEPRIAVILPEFRFRRLPCGRRSRIPPRYFQSGLPHPAL